MGGQGGAREGKEGREGYREGRGGTGRDRGEKEGGRGRMVGRGGAPPPLETSPGSAPVTIRSQTKRSVSKLSSP